MERISVSCYLRKNTLRLLAIYWKPPRHPRKHCVSFTCLRNTNYFSVGTFKSSLESPRKKPNQKHPLYFATIEETFDITKGAHIATDHVVRDKMIKEINKTYANITHDAITLFKSMCIECQIKRKRTTTKGIVKPILSKDSSTCNLCAKVNTNGS